jgi:hypothetical protein
MKWSKADDAEPLLLLATSNSLVLCNPLLNEAAVVSKDEYCSFDWSPVNKSLVITKNNNIYIKPLSWSCVRVNKPLADVATYSVFEGMEEAEHLSECSVIMK